MGRSPCCSKVGLRRGPWSSKEDTVLTNYIQQHGEGQWRSLPKNAGLLRCGKSCRLRWMNYLRPGIKRGNIDEDEEDLIVRLHALLGNRWSLIAGRLPGRTDNEIKNYWNTHLLKKLNSAGIHPIPHKVLKSDPNLKKVKQKRTVAETKTNKNVESSENADPPKTRVYLPKAMRVSSLPDFSRSSSYESLVSRASSSDGGWGKAEEMMAPVEWPPLFEVEDGGFGVNIGGGDEEGFMGGEYGQLPVLSRSEFSISGDVEMLEKVYDEYLQLL